MQLYAGTSKDFIGDATRNSTARAILRFLVVLNLPQSRSEANWSTILLSSNSRESPCGLLILDPQCKRD